MDIEDLDETTPYSPGRQIISYCHERQVIRLHHKGKVIVLDKENTEEIFAVCENLVEGV